MDPQSTTEPAPDPQSTTEPAPDPQSATQSEPDPQSATQSEPGFAAQSTEAYSCPADIDAQLDELPGAGHSVADFVDSWVPRLQGAVPVGGGSLDDFLDRTSLPADVAAEGYHSLDLDLRQCLTRRLSEALQAEDPSFPHPSLTEPAALALLYGFVFDNTWVEDFQASTPPGDPTVTDNPIPSDPVDALLASLRTPQLPAVPTATLPAGLDPVPLALKTASELQDGLLNPVDQLFTDLGDVVPDLGLPVTLPPIGLPTVDLATVLDRLRGAVDSTTYRVCWTTDRTAGKTLEQTGSAGTTATVRTSFQATVPGTGPDSGAAVQCSLDVPLGTPVPVDLAGDVRPDVTAQLTPSLDLTNPVGSVQMRWVLTRLPAAATGYSGDLKAHVFSLFSLPTADVQLSVGSDGFKSTLAGRSEYVFTLTDVQQAAAGNAVIEVEAHHVDPGASSAVTYGVAPIERDAQQLGAGSTSTFDVGTLNFTPVPASNGLTLSNPVAATLTVRSGDFDEDGNVDERLGVDLTMPQSGVVLDARLLSKLPPAGSAECCPFRDIRGTVAAIPTDVEVVVDSFPAKRTTDVTYEADAEIDRVDFESTMYADTDADLPADADRNTFTKVTAQVTDLPRRVHAQFTTPDPATPAKTTVVHYDADSPVTRLRVSSEEWAHDPVVGAAAKQRRLRFEADSIPSRIDLTGTTTEISSRHSTGQVVYDSNGSVTGVELEVEDQIGASELVADVASLPRAFSSTYDVKGPADLDPENAGCEDPGHTVLHADGRTAIGAAPGSAALGEIRARYRSRVSDFLVPDATIAGLQHAVVNRDPRDPGTCLDDTLQADLRYGGLRLLDAEVLESGKLSTRIRNDLEQQFVLQVDDPDQRLTARVQDLPQQMTFSKEPDGPGRSTVTYDGCTPSGPTCTPRTIDSLKVRLDGKGTGKDFSAGEFVDATATTVPDHVELHLDLPDAEGSTKSVAFRASGRTDVTAAVRKGVADLGELSIAAEVTGIPEQFDLSFGKDVPIVFSSGTGQAIDRIEAAVTNTGTARAPAAFSPHAYARYVESPDAAPQLEATLGLANLQSFSVDPGSGGGSFTGTVKTTVAPTGPNPNSSFGLTADVLTLATLKTAGGDDVLDADGEPVPDPDLRKATVIKTGPGGAVLDPLPSSVVIRRSGGVQPDRTDTSTLTIDTSGSAQKPALSGDVAIGNPASVAEALAEVLDPVQGVNVGDGSAGTEAGAVRLRLFLPVLPSKAVVRYGQITTELQVRPSDPSFDVRGFGPLPEGRLSILVDLDDEPAAEQMTANISVRGLAPSLAMLQLLPINLRPNAAGDLDLDVSYNASQSGGDLDLDLTFGRTGSRPDKRVTVHTDVVPPQVAFRAELGEAAAPDLAQFRAEFRDASGALTASPGHTTFTFQTPAADGADNPPAKVALDLEDVPSLLAFAVEEAASTKRGNPDEGCGLVESDFVLPTLEYQSEGANRNQLDLAGEIDLSFIEPGAPKVVFDLVDLADGFTVRNTDEGKKYDLENPGGTTTKVLVKVLPLDITLLHINWRRCAEPTGAIGWKSSGEAKVGVSTQLRLQIDQLEDVQLEPGFSTGITGSYGRLTLGLPSPTFQAQFSGGFRSGLHIRLSDTVKGTIPVLAAPDGTVSFPLPIVFHVARSEPGKWFGLNTHIPCVVPGFELIVQANIEPHRVRLERNQFTATGGSFVVTPDPFGASAGLSVLFGGVDIIDSIAGLFTSPYDHGIRSPSLECEFFL